MTAHVHNFVVRDDFVRPDSVRQVERRCICGLAERRRYDGQQILTVRYRYDEMGGGWVDAAALLKLTLPVRLCDVCKGIESTRGCVKCDGLLVLEDDGRPLDPPPKKPRRRA